MTFLYIPITKKFHLTILPILSILVLLVSSCGSDDSSSSSAQVEYTPKVAPISELMSISKIGAGREIAIFGDYYFIAAQNDGVTIIKLSDNSTFSNVGNIPVINDESAYSVAVSGNHLYLAARSGGLKVYDITNPELPTEVFTYDTPDLATSITIDGDSLYLSDRGFFLIFDLSIPSQPGLKGQLESDGYLFMQSAISSTDNLAYIAGHYGGLIAVDIENPEIPVREWRIPTEFQTTSVTLYDNYVLIAGAGGGLTVFPKKLGDKKPVSSTALIDTPSPEAADEQGFKISISNSHAFVADGPNGLQVVNLENIKAPYIAGNYATNGSSRDVLIHNDFTYLLDKFSGLQQLQVQIYEDTDGDSIHDAIDIFPTDPTESIDTDGDGIGNNADTDDDEDGIPDEVDTDDDNDNVVDEDDWFPADPDFWIDSDGDGFGDNNELLVVDNESIHCEVNGTWENKQSSLSLAGSSYLRQPADSSEDSVTWRPIVNSAGKYNVYVTWPYISSGLNNSTATFQVKINGETTDFILDQNSGLKKWNLLGEFDFPIGNNSSITLLDSGTPSENSIADAVKLISSLKVPVGYTFEENYTYIGKYSEHSADLWDIRRMFLDTVNPNIVYGALNIQDFCSFNIEDLSAPALVNCYRSDDNGQGREVVRKDDYFILADRKAGLRVFEDLGGGDFNLVNSIPTFDKASRLTLNGDILYVGDTLGGILAYDVSDAANPIYLNRVEVGAETRDTKILGDYAFVANYYIGLAVVNIADPANPVLTTRLDTPHRSKLGGAWDLEIKGQNLFILQQTFGVQIADISVPGKVNIISEIEMPDGEDYGPPGAHSDWPPLGIELVNNLLLVSNGAYGVLLLDIEDIKNIKIVDLIDTPGVAGDTVLSGSTLYVADGIQGGLRVYDIAEYSYLYDPQ